MKKINKILVIVFISIFAAVIVKDQIIKSVVTVAATQVLGSPVHIDGFSLGIFKQSVKISGFKIYNPKGFSKGVLLDLPRINVGYDLGAILKGKLHLPNVEVELKEMLLEKNAKGELNVDSLKVAKQGKAQESKPAKQMPIQLDIVKLGMGRIISRDYSADKGPVVKVYDINIHKTYKNITSAQQLAALILTEPMKAAGIEGAKIYGAAMLVGVAVLPVALAATFLGKDSTHQVFNSSFDTAFETSLMVLKKMGSVSSQDKARGTIAAQLDSVQVNVKFGKTSENKTEIVISARKHLLPKPEIAGGILYEIGEKLK